MEWIKVHCGIKNVKYGVEKISNNEWISNMEWKREKCSLETVLCMEWNSYAIKI
jgi:hypothetical protein